MEGSQGTNSLALMLFESPLDVEPLNMIEPFADSAINYWSGTLYAVGGVPDPNMMTNVSVGANEELHALIREMRRRKSATEHLCDDLQDVILARDNQISAYMNKIDRLRYERRRMLSEISALEEEVARLRRGQSSRRRR
ncbi:hypothetical protein Tco_1009682 [Tanacetum coccineum]